MEPTQYTEQLHKVAQELTKKPKGIIAMDESTGTVGKRLEQVGLENTEENRREFRELLVTAPGFSAIIAGAILYEETFAQKLSTGKTFVQTLKEKGIHAGIKLDQKAVDSAPGEKLTNGLEGLDARVKDYTAKGAAFAKWRSVITISETTPTDANTLEDMRRLAVYAKTCQAHGVVPIVEPEVLMEGNHTIERKEAVTTKVLQTLFAQLEIAGVDLAGIILKPNMIVQGKELGPDSKELVASKTLSVLKACVPPTVGGIAFLSGGLSDEYAIGYLNEMNKTKDLPWNLTFSFSRAIQLGPLALFGAGKKDEAQALVQTNLQLCSGATTGSN